MSTFPLREYYCQSGYFLQIDPSGEVSGINRSGHKNAIFEVMTVKSGVITMKAVHSGMFLAIDETGKPHGKTQRDESCEFLEKFDPSGRYFIFQPRRFSAEGWHLALGRQGKTRPAHKISADQKCAWFLHRVIGGEEEEETTVCGINIDLDLLKKLGFTSATGHGLGH